MVTLNVLKSLVVLLNVLTQSKLNNTHLLVLLRSRCFSVVIVLLGVLLSHIAWLCSRSAGQSRTQIEIVGVAMAQGKSTISS